MPLLGLLTADDAAAVQALLSVPGQDMDSLLPFQTILLPSIGGRAEAIVAERLGSDWPLFVVPAPISGIPLYYAQGNQALAATLLHDALVQFACARVVDSGILQQVVVVSEATADEKLVYGVNWTSRQDSFVCQGNEALNLLRRPFPVAGRTFVSPAAGASGQMCQTIRTRVPGRGCWGGAPWSDDRRW